LTSSQLSETIEAELSRVEDLLATGDDLQLLDWLREHAHPLGRQVNGEELVKQVSGRPLDSAPFLRYLREKLERLRLAGAG